MVVTVASKDLTGSDCYSASKDLTGSDCYISLRRLNWPDVTLVSENVTDLMLH